jgi:hypothetical protein
MLIPLGFLAGSGGDDSSYEHIISSILGSGTTSISFTDLNNYSSIYKHLQLRIAVKSTITSGRMDNMTLRFNNDTGNNYATHILFGNGTSVSSAAFTSQPFMYLPSSIGATFSTPTTSMFSAHVIDILDVYSTTKNKTIRALNGYTDTVDDAGRRVGLSSAFWNNTAALTSITMSTSGNFVAGTRLSLYGIRG